MNALKLSRPVSTVEGLIKKKNNKMFTKNRSKKWVKFFRKIKMAEIG